jgi:hypothetical protein
MLARKDLVTHLDDQLMAFVIEAFTGMVGVGGGLLQEDIGANHFARDQVPADAEVLERALRLGAPELVSGNGYLAKAVGLFTNVWHVISCRLQNDNYRAPTMTGLFLPRVAIVFLFKLRCAWTSLGVVNPIHRFSDTSAK